MSEIVIKIRPEIDPDGIRALARETIRIFLEEIADFLRHPFRFFGA